MKKIQHALIFSTLWQHSTQLISFATIIILARLLKPEEIGVFAVASAFAFLATEFRSLGVGQYLIREEELDNDKIRSASGLMIIVSWTLAALLVLFAPWISSFYSEPDLTSIFLIISLAFLVAPFSAIPNAIIIRNMQFSTIVRVKITSSLVRSAVSIGLALLGFSYFSLAWGTLAGAIAEVIAFSFVRPQGIPWLPQFRNLRPLLNFGLSTSTANSLQNFSPNIPDMVLGRLTSMAEVGLFSRGLGLITFLNKIVVQAVTPVILPHFSEIQRERKSLADEYMRTSALLTGLCWPVFAVVNVAAYPMIRGLFGDQWDHSIPIASVLSLWAILQTTHCFSSQLLITLKFETLFLRREILLFAARIIAIVVSAPYGLTYVAWALTLTGVLELFVNSYIVHKKLGITIKKLVLNFIPSLSVCVICWITVKLYFDGAKLIEVTPLWALAQIALLMPVVWICAVFLTKHSARNLLISIGKSISQIATSKN